MTISDWIALISAIASIGLAVISLWALWGTLQQNKVMLESSTRPYISAMYEMVILPKQEIARYIVIKNFGHTSGTLLDIQIEGPISEQSRRQIYVLQGATIMPGQRFFYYFAGANDQNPEVLSVKLTYTAPDRKTYSETSELKMITGTNKKRAVNMESIPLLLQDISDRLL